MRSNVESLLAHDEAGGFPSETAVDDALRVIGHGGRRGEGPRAVGPYKVLEQIGAGGMGDVYRALDTRLGRHVALKLLPDCYASDKDHMRRFVQEACHASSLNHPNIITVHDIGSEGETRYIATELIEGETLRDIISRGPLPLPDALDITVHIAEALEVAHEAGIVHRDIKPENVMLRRRDQIVKVLDFGLAKLTQRQPAAADTQAETRPLVKTDTGVVLGTVVYMSPEQLRGEGADARSDLWSLGVVLYEMVAGRRPFDGSAQAEVVSSILRDEPVRLPEGTPERLRSIIRKALDKDREKRFQSAAEMLEGLRGLSREVGSGRVAPQRRPAAGAPTDVDASPSAPLRPGARRRVRLMTTAGALALVVVAAAYAVYRFRAPVAADGKIDSLAVLPFQNVGGSPDTEYLSDGITDSLINSLSQLPNIRVMSRNSVFRFKGRETETLEAARALNVRAVLTGQVRQRGDALSITVALVDARDDRHLWGTQYNRKLTDILAVQEEITREISEKLRLRLTGEEQKLLTKRYTEDTEAYQLYLKGNYFWNKFTPDAERTAIDYYTQAIVLDPNFALPYAGLVHAYQVSANNGWMRPRDAYPKAKVALAKGLELNPNNPSLLTAAASTAMFYDWDWEAAESGFKRANEIEPDYWHHHELYAYLLTVQGRSEEAIAEARRAQEIDPLSLIAHTSAGHTFFFSRQYDRSAEQVRKSLELDPKFAIGQAKLARIFVQQGKYEEAIAAYKLATSMMGRTSQNVGQLGYVHALSGNRAEALKLLNELKEMSARQYVSPLDFVFIHTGLGDKEQALAYLEKSYQERSAWLMWIKVDPRFDLLRSDPRFTDLLRRMNLN